MTTTAPKTRLREVARADEESAVATYEAIHHDRVLGIIKKFKEPDWATDNEVKRNPYRNCYWTHSLDDGSGRDRYETSAACIEALERAAGVES